VRLVIYSLLEGLRNFDRPDDMRRRLNELPENLEDLYWHMIDRVTSKWYVEEGFRLLLLVKAATKAAKRTYTWISM
jgi:chromatin segregation and condensation protein Rec8/ScpA/Scc1 (kleisin family)